MSKTNPVSTSASASSLEQPNKRSRRKLSKVRLPTPPPDPQENDPLGCNLPDKEAEFLEYLEMLQKSTHPGLSRSTSVFAPALATEDAFDHLDRLYKLMEQMLTLREQNVLLHRRVMDLERLRNLQNMNKHLDPQKDFPSFDPDTPLTESYLYNILNDSKKAQKLPSKFGPSILRKSQRSRHSDEGYERRISMGFSDKSSKVSKWTKVKAAFKWEKASQTVSDAKSQDSGLGGMLPVNYEMARYLRVPSNSDEIGVSPADSGAAEISTPATLSSASSTEDINRHARRRNQEETSDDDQAPPYEYIPSGKDDPQTSKSSSIKSHKNPWTKVKDILQTQTRNSFKKKHRLSVKSDDFKIEDSIVSDNEEVFESEEPKSPILIIQSPEEISKENEELSNQHNIPVDVIARYRVINEDSKVESNHEKHESKWGKVKKAFLSSPTISRLDNNSSPGSTNDGTLSKKVSVSSKESEEKLHEEIQRNYLELQKKLSLEFQEKLQEWERSKSNAQVFMSSPNTPSTVMQEDTKDLAFKKKMEEWEKIKGQPRHNLQLQSEQNLPPEFRKKLEEWKKIKKFSGKEDSSKKKLGERPKWKSVGHRGELGLEYQQLSDDFIKKYQSWKQIKSGSATPTEETCDNRSSTKGNNTPSPRMGRKDGSLKDTKKIKEQTDKELQWYEKELGKIEREKQRLERDRQKFLDREERETKSKKSASSGSKKEILVQTPSGFYRFEGISRKFTQKLYEWEKARGIGPEDSTFALLKSACIPHIRLRQSDDNPNGLVRSKSADSVIGPDLNSVMCPLLSQQPSSLSLNDMEHLEKNILLENSSSVPDIIGSHENMEEPEALIVEVEDVVEETASFLENKLEKHFPVYQKQETSNMWLCEGETRVAPMIRRSESVRAQANYNLIEEIMDILKNLIDNEKEIEFLEKKESNFIFEEDISIIKDKQESQKMLSSSLIDKLVFLQEANNNIASDIAKEESQFTVSRVVDVLDTIQDISLELFNLAEAIDHNIYNRNKKQLEAEFINSTKQMYPEISESLVSFNNKVLELRRNLSYVCAASDLSFSNWKKKIENHKNQRLEKKPSIERRRGVFRKSKSREGSKDSQNSEYDNVSPSLGRQIEQGAIKKRQRYRQKGYYSKSIDESDDDENFEKRKHKPRKIRSQNSTESNKSITEIRVSQESKEGAKIEVDPVVVEKVVVPTKSNILNFEETPIIEAPDTPVTFFIKTTRKLFTPIAEINTNIEREENVGNHSTLVKDENEQQGNNSALQNVSVSVPSSPMPQRKPHKEISPNIRLMMVKYNQKICEESGLPKSTGSSGSASPTAWRSPVLDRRVKAQTERYQKELQKMSPLLGGRREVQKSASMGVVVSGNKQYTLHSKANRTPENSPKVTRGILKSSSTSVIQNKKATEVFPTFHPIPESETSVFQPNPSKDERSSKIQKAKEEFLNSTPNISTQNNNQSTIVYPSKNRLSQISVGSESSYSSNFEGLLVKSASAGMINIDPDAYRQFNPEIHVDGYVSLPRSSKKTKESLLTNLTSKFRKVKMRRSNKDGKKMDTVSTLCRQSLMVDIQNDHSQETLSEEQQSSRLSIPSDSRGSSSNETSPSTSRAGSWIKRSKIFKTKL